MTDTDRRKIGALVAALALGAASVATLFTYANGQLILVPGCITAWFAGDSTGYFVRRWLDSRGRK